MKLTRIRYFFNYYYLAIASFVIVLLLTLLVYQETYQRVQERNEKLFNLKTSQVQVDIENRMRDYIQILKGGKALYKASESVTRSDWAIYVKWLQIEENYPGIQGIGFAPYLRSDELPQHIAQVEAEKLEEAPNYTIFPEGKREIYTPISFIEPFTGRNRRAFGFDMFSDPRRREAMERARDSGDPVLSGKVQLIQ